MEGMPRRRGRGTSDRAEAPLRARGHRWQAMRIRAEPPEAKTSHHHRLGRGDRPSPSWKHCRKTAPTPDLAAQQIAASLNLIRSAGVSEWQRLYVDQSTNPIDLQAPRGAAHLARQHPRGRRPVRLHPADHPRLADRAPRAGRLRGIGHPGRRTGRAGNLRGSQRSRWTWSPAGRADPSSGRSRRLVELLVVGDQRQSRSDLHRPGRARARPLGRQQGGHGLPVWRTRSTRRARRTTLMWNDGRWLRRSS